MHRTPSLQNSCKLGSLHSLMGLCTSFKDQVEHTWLKFDPKISMYEDNQGWGTQKGCPY
jgi:hypothetical protein